MIEFQWPSLVVYSRQKTKEGLIMLSYHGRPLTRRFHLVRSSFMQEPGLAFANVLSEAQVEQAFDQEGVSFAEGEDDVFTPAMTLWAFLSQVLYKDEQRSCLAAVTRVIVLLVGLGRPLVP